MKNIKLPCGEYIAHLDADYSGIYALGKPGDEYCTFIHVKRPNWASKLYKKYKSEIDQQLQEA